MVSRLLSAVVGDNPARGWEERCRRAATDAEAKRQVFEAAVELRDRLVLEGVDQGRRIADVAQAALMSRARVQQIIAAKG